MEPKCHGNRAESKKRNERRWKNAKVKKTQGEIEIGRKEKRSTERTELSWGNLQAGSRK